MRTPIRYLLKRLHASEEETQWHAVAELQVLLEHATERPEANEELRNAILGDELRALSLAKSEIEDVLVEAVAALSSDAVCRSTKISLFWILVKFAAAKHGEALLQCLSEYGDTLDEKEAFSSVAALNIFFKRSAHDASFRSLVAKHNITGLLQKFKAGSSPRLRRSAEALLEYLLRNGITPTC